MASYPPLKIRVLGTGTSTGVPVVGCKCPVCTSPDPHNKRLRSSISVDANGFHILVDCSIDFRQQMLTWPMPRIDAILLTHSHSDHVNGIDDLRAYNYMQKASIPLYSGQLFLDDLRARFSYCFNPFQRGGGVPELNLMPIRFGEPIKVGGLEIMPLRVLHGRLSIMGFRLGRFAYLTDCNGIPEETEALLKGVDTVIISALRHTPHSTHFTLAQSLEVSRRLGVRRAFFTHIADEMDHATTNRELPDWANLLYDGQEILVD